MGQNMIQLSKDGTGQNMIQLSKDGTGQDCDPVLSRLLRRCSTTSPAKKPENILGIKNYSTKCAVYFLL